MCDYRLPYLNPCQPIFGGFIAAFAIPHEGGFAIALVSKIEDVSVADPGDPNSWGLD